RLRHHQQSGVARLHKSLATRLAPPSSPAWTRLNRRSRCRQPPANWRFDGILRHFHPAVHGDNGRLPRSLLPRRSCTTGFVCAAFTRLLTRLSNGVPGQLSRVQAASDAVMSAFPADLALAAPAAAQPSSTQPAPLPGLYRRISLRGFLLQLLPRLEPGALRSRRPDTRLAVRVLAANGARRAERRSAPSDRPGAAQPGCHGGPALGHARGLRPGWRRPADCLP
uniref:Integron gene cassette protein n=1 Tax=Macrostomum lignano TaxID=282301 RepID=A0A1I8FFN1_9PLAT